MSEMVLHPHRSVNRPHRCDNDRTPVPLVPVVFGDDDVREPAGIVMENRRTDADDPVLV